MKNGIQGGRTIVLPGLIAPKTCFFSKPTFKEFQMKQSNFWLDGSYKKLNWVIQI